MSQQKVLVLVGDAAEELDAMYPIYRLREAGYVADVAALTRRDVQLVIHDFDPNSDAYTEKNGRKLPVDITFAEVDPAEYVGARHPRRPRARVHPRSTPTCAGSRSTSSSRTCRSARSATARRCPRSTGCCADARRPPSRR